MAVHGELPAIRKHLRESFGIDNLLKTPFQARYKPSAHDDSLDMSPYMEYIEASNYLCVLSRRKE